MSEFTDNIKAIEASLDLRDQCIHEQHERIVRLEQELAAIEAQLRVVEQALARATGLPV